MGEALLATSGDTVKLCDAATYTFHQEISPESGHVNTLEWNQDGQRLASPNDSEKEIHLSAIRNKLGANIGIVRGIESPTCLSFARRTPHYLGVGSATGMVTVWNVKSQAKKKVFMPTDRAISKVTFSHNDSHIAAATRKGTLYMLSYVNNLTAGPYQLFNKQVVTDLTYSRVKKSLLGCCSDGGSVALYDTHANKVLHAFPSAHNSPVAAISFSPVNELLMVSVGYDKKLSCFNVQTKQPVMTHRSSAPLTSITFLSMGQLVALGTMTGQVLVHDMRNIRTPLATLKAHKTAVTSVLLQPCPEPKKVTSSGTGQRGTTAATPAASAPRPSKPHSDQSNEASPELRAKPQPSPETSNFHMNVLSPIRDTNLPTQVQTSEPEGPDNLTCFKMDIPMESVTQSLFSPIRTTDLQHNPNTSLFQQMDINEDNLLSPIRDTTLITRSDSIFPESPVHQLQPPTTMEVTLTPPTDITDKENIEPSAAVTEEHNSALQHQTDYKSNATPSTIDALHREEPSSSTIAKPPQGHALTPKVDLSSCLPDGTQRLTLPPAGNSLTAEERSKAATSSITSLPTVVTSPAPQLTMPLSSPFKLSPPKKRQLLRSVQASDLAPDTPPPPQPQTAAAIASGLSAASHDIGRLQMELVRSCMVDVMEEFQDEVNSRLMHLQYIITKKFIQQQEVMEQLHRQYSLNEDLMKENERLRQQVAHLQAKY